jgi:hypothetical protein
MEEIIQKYTGSFIEENYTDRQFIIIIDDIDPEYIGDFPNGLKRDVLKRHRNTVKMPFDKEHITYKDHDKKWYTLTEIAKFMWNPWWLFSYKTMLHKLDKDKLFDYMCELKSLKDKINGLFLLTATEARGLKFPVGHPKKGILYIGHPSEPLTYLIANDFHTSVLENKFWEVVRILVALGATSIEIEHINGESSHLSFNLETMYAKGQVEKTHSTNSSIFFKANFEPKKEPKLPENLFWYHEEHTWQQIAEHRLLGGMKDFQFVIENENDFGVNASLESAVLGRSSVSLGGKVKSHKSSTWRISGEF